MKLQPPKTLLTLALGVSATTTFSVLNLPTISYAAPGQRPPSGSRPGATPGSTPTAKPSATSIPRPTPPPKPTSGNRDVNLLEGALARTLTNAEKTAIVAAAKTRDASIKKAHDNFATEVATILNLNPSQLREPIQSCEDKKGDLLTRLEKMLGGALTAEEITDIAEAGSTRELALEEAHEIFRETAAAALSLTVEALDAKVKAYQQSQRGGQSGRR
jgi:transposase-like protein